MIVLIALLVIGYGTIASLLMTDHYFEYDRLKSKGLDSSKSARALIMSVVWPLGLIIKVKEIFNDARKV